MGATHSRYVTTAAMESHREYTSRPPTPTRVAVGPIAFDGDERESLSAIRRLDSSAATCRIRTCHASPHQAGRRGRLHGMKHRASKVDRILEWSRGTCNLLVQRRLRFGPFSHAGTSLVRSRGACVLRRARSSNSRTFTSVVGEKSSSHSPTGLDVFRSPRRRKRHLRARPSALASPALRSGDGLVLASWYWHLAGNFRTSDIRDPSHRGSDAASRRTRVTRCPDGSGRL